MQLRGGTTAENLLFTGAQREVTVDTDKNTLVVQDGITAGGFPLATEEALSDGTFYYNDDTAGGSVANAYILAPKVNTNTPTSYLDGIQLGFTTANANTGPSSANFQGLGVKNLKYRGGSDPLAGDISGRVYLIYDAVNDWLEIQRKATVPAPQIRSITATVASNALTFSLTAPVLIDFRSSVLGSGAVNQRSVTSSLSIVVPAGATLGTTNATANRIVLVAIDNAGTVELAVINLTGGNNLDETTLINTTAISAGSSSASVFYSTTARTGVPFRVLGYAASTQTIAGTWAAAPTEVQGQGGQALAAMASIGYGQLWQSVTGSRSLNTAFTNTTGKPIAFYATIVSTSAAAVVISVAVNGVVVGTTTTPPLSSGVNTATGAIIVPHGATYNASLTSGAANLQAWSELR